MRSRIELARVGPLSTGLSVHKRLQPLAIKKMPLAAPPPRDNRFGRPLELAKVHWIRPELVAEITYLSWPEDGLLLSLKVRRALIGRASLSLVRHLVDNLASVERVLGRGRSIGQRLFIDPAESHLVRTAPCLIPAQVDVMHNPI